MKEAQIIVELWWVIFSQARVSQVYGDFMASNHSELEVILRKVQRLNELTNEVIRAAQSHSIDMGRSVGPLSADFRTALDHGPNVISEVWDLSSPETAALSLAAAVAVEMYQPVADAVSSFLKKFSLANWFRKREYESQLNEILGKKQELAVEKLGYVNNVEAKLRGEAEKTRKELQGQASVKFGADLPRFINELQRLETKRNAYQHAHYASSVASFLSCELGSWKAGKHSSASRGPDPFATMQNAFGVIDAASCLEESHQAGYEIHSITCGAIFLLTSERTPGYILNNQKIQGLVNTLTKRYVWGFPWGDGVSEFKQFFQTFLEPSATVKEALKKKRFWKRLLIFIVLFTVLSLAVFSGVKSDQKQRTHQRVEDLLNSDDPCSVEELSQSDRVAATEDQLRRIQEKDAKCTTKKQLIQQEQANQRACSELISGLEQKTIPQTIQLDEPWFGFFTRMNGRVLRPDDLQNDFNNLPCQPYDSPRMNRLFVEAAAHSSKAWEESITISKDLHEALASRQPHLEPQAQRVLLRSSEKMAKSAMGGKISEKMKVGIQKCELVTSLGFTIRDNCKNLINRYNYLLKKQR